MPQYTPVDPRLVAFNPQQLTAGALSTIELANELSKRKAFLAQQAELEATRHGRLAAENTVNQSVVNVRPHQDIASIALAQNRAAVLPGQTEAELADQSFQAQRRPRVQDIQLTKDMVDEALGPIAGDLALGQARHGLTKLDIAKELDPLKGQLEVAQTEDTLASLPEDKARNDRLKNAKAKLEEAQAELAEANADYVKRDKPKADAANRNLTELKNIQLQIQHLENGGVINPNSDNLGKPMPLIQYQAQTRGPDGNLIVNKGFPIFGTDTVMKTNPEAEQRSAELKGLYALRNSLTEQITGGSKASTQAPSAKLSAADAAKLPKGTKFIGLDGIERVRN